MTSVDYNKLYPIPRAHNVQQAMADIHSYEWEHCDACAEYADMLVTPRNAAALSFEARWLADMMRSDLDAGASDSVEAYLPKYARRVGNGFYEQFIDVFTTLADRIDAGHGCQPRSTAEELALAAIIDECQSMGVGEGDVETDTVDELVEHPNDFNYALLDSALFEDHDIRFTFDFERHSGDLFQWFEPFSAETW